MRSTWSKALLILSRSAFATSLGLLSFTLVLLCATAAGQASAGGSPPSVVDRVDASAGFNFIRANAPPGNCHCFDTLGGYGSVGYHITNWISIQGEVTGQHATDIGTLGQDLTLITYAGGPRFSVPGRRFVPFVQGLFGEAKATDSYFPTGNGGSTSSASSFALLAGGGLDYNITRHLGIRVFNVEFLRTSFPNGTDNSQNHLSLGAGLIARFGNKNGGRKYKELPPPPDEPVPPPPPPPPAPVEPPPPPPPPPAPEPTIKMLCSADVSSVDQGAALELSAKTLTQPEDLTVTYTWTSAQGQIIGSGRRVLLDTTGLAPGEYTAQGHASATASKPLAADCEIQFRVKTVAETIAAPSGPPSGPPIDPAREREFHENVPDALFDYNSAAIRPDTQRAINHAKEYLDQHPDIRVLLGGFADNRGTVEYNLKLGMKRAIATRNAMIAAGIAPERLQIVTYGKEVQVCTANTEVCRQQNRRVMFSMHP